ncbi:membrane associated rhomboid family serine protease [Dysgonomonas sp. PH5-45]|uniref:rhomboid family intramembrane serine protease n=1 Tax=unclassified Dysgonomonas TaxID=2630389 RepID=UPI00247493E1|nr:MULTISPECIES: rhomboid family intramembrane serine protease [unclassified Dysgonomonas]MDH6355321.1 membrane associated rhomboid family serine protease [Dysgonomonas sp. PH5-45]MDH6388219.1 membrane associated rhomboid family serine protease [Dysgonomonas sp. PH5-37]
MNNIAPITLGIIAVTTIVSLIGFSNQALFDRMKFNVGAILHDKQWDRVMSSALLHGDMMHLIFNMLTLYFFAKVLIAFVGTVYFVAVYLAAILCGGLLSLYFHRKNSHYSAIGASGGVTGVLFATIALYPEIGIAFFFIPIPIPGWIFAILYLAFSIYAMKGQLGNIGHEAHLGGAVIGLVLALIMVPEAIYVNAVYIAIMFVPILVLAYMVYKERK